MKLQEYFRTNISKNVKIAFLSALIVGFLTHLTLIVLQPVCADPVLFLDLWKNGDWQLYNQGRWTSNLFFALRGFLVVPALSCILTILDCAICSAMFVRIFHINKSYIAALVGAAIVVHPYFANMQMYYVTAGTFLFTLIMVSLYLTYCSSLRVQWKLIISSGILMITLAFSQSMLCAFTIVVAIKLIKDILENKPNKWKNFITNVGVAIVGTSVYLVIWNALLYLKKITGLYGGAESYGLANTIKNLFISIIKTYKILWDYLFGDEIVHNSYWHREIMNFVLIGTLCIALAVVIQKLYSQRKISLKSLLCVVAVLVCLPIALAPFVLVVTEYTFYLMTANGYVFIIPAILTLLDNINTDKIMPKLIKDLGIITVVIIIWTFALSDNAGYLLLNNTFTQTKELSSRVLLRIEQLDDFTYDREVCFIGQPDHQAYAPNITLYQASPGSTFSQMGVFSGIWENSDGWGLYIYHYSGVKLNYYSNGQQQRIAELSESEEFKNSGCWPANDSVQIIDGTVVVKLGEVDYSSYVNKNEGVG